MRKKLLLSSVLSLCGLSLMAQSENTWGPFEPTTPWSNIYIGADAGAQTIWGNSKLSPLRHNADIQIGKLWSPFFSTRLKFEMGRFKTSENGTEYKHKQFTSFVWHADAVFNFTNIFGGYNPDRFYSFKGFLGLGAEHTWGAGNAFANYESRKATQLAVFAGITNTFRLSPAFDLNFEIQGALMPKEIEGEPNRGWRPHGQLSAMIGVAYKFKPRGFSGVIRSDNSRHVQRITQLERELNTCTQQNRQYQQDLQNTRNALQAAQSAPAGCATNPQSGQQQVSCPTTMACGCPMGNCTCGKSGDKKQQNRANTTVMPEMAVFFNINSAKISARETLQLQLYADAIKAACCPYVVVGYADIQTGSRAYNEKLALSRAEAVVNMLVNKYGVNPSLLKAQLGNLDNPPFTDTIYNRTSIIRVP